MRRRTLFGSALVGLAFFVSSPVTVHAQFDLATKNPELADSPFAEAFSRWLENIDNSELGRHLAENPEDSSGYSAAWLGIQSGDFSRADDAAIINIFELFDDTMAAAPVEACSGFIGGDGGNGFMELLATADSAIAARWVGAIEQLILSTLDPGKTSPPADKQTLQTAILKVILELPEDERMLWVRLATEPETLSQEEDCEATRIMFHAFNDIPKDERAGILRAASVGGSK